MLVVAFLESSTDYLIYPYNIFIFQRLASHLHSKRSFPYLINLDPAAGFVPFPANIDIRDTVIILKFYNFKYL